MRIVRIEHQKDYLLLPDLLWDGISDNPAKGQAVFINKGVIGQFVPVSSLCDSTMESLETIRLDGTLMPGLVDCHVHFSMNCENLFQAIDEWDNQPHLVEDRVRKAAADYLVNGVLAVRDGGDKKNIGLQVRNSINSGRYPGPVVTAAGRAVYRKGRYGEFLGPGIESVNEALTQIELFRKEGINQLKVIVSGLVSFKEFGVVGSLQFTTSELRAIVNKAHSLGLKVMAHASSVEAVEAAIRAGVDSVEHGYFLKTRLLELMAKYLVAWVPTLAPLGNLAAGRHLPYEGADMEVIRKTHEIQMARVKEAFELGVMIGVGTDAGANRVRHGYSYHEELSYYAAAGLSSHSILRLATSVSAKIIGRSGEIGAISQGQKPFLIGVPGNPFKSLDVLKNPELVILPENLVD